MEHELKIIYKFKDGYTGNTEAYLDNIKLGILTELSFYQNVKMRYPNVKLHFGISEPEVAIKCGESLQNNLIKYYDIITNMHFIKSNILNLKKYINLKAFL
jgi:hypothetical protein